MSEEKDEGNKYLRTSEAARWLGISVSQVCYYAKAGRLVVVETPRGRRFKTEDVWRLKRELKRRRIRLQKKAAGRKKRPVSAMAPEPVAANSDPNLRSAPPLRLVRQLETKPKVPAVETPFRSGSTVKVIRPGMCDTGLHGCVEKGNDYAMVYVRIQSPGPEHGRCYLHSNLADLEIIGGGDPSAA